MANVEANGFDDDVRVLTFPESSDAVLCMTATSTCVYWVSAAQRLHMWDKRCSAVTQDGTASDAEEPQCLGELGFNPAPRLIAATEDGEVVLANGVHLGLYTVDRTLLSTEHERDDNGAYAPELMDELSLQEIFVTSCQVNHPYNLAVSADGFTAALSSSSELVLVNCRELGSAESVRPPDMDSDLTGAALETRTTVLRVDCSDWFGSGCTGATRTCFLPPIVDGSGATVPRLLALGEGGHLVSVCVDWAVPTVWRQRDGHVVSRAHSVCAMDARGSLLALGMSNGTVALYQTESLAALAVVNVVGELERRMAPVVDESVQRRLSERPWLRPSAPAQRAGQAFVKGSRAPRSSGADTQRTGERYTYAAVASRAPPDSRRAASTGATPAQLDPTVLCVAVGVRFVTVALAETVVRVSRDTLTLVDVLPAGEAFPGACFFEEIRGPGGAEVPQVIACAADGSWAAWWGRPSNVFAYYAAAPSYALTEEEGTPVDVVHAFRPLPSRWRVSMQPFTEADKGVLPSSQRRKTTPQPVTFGHGIKGSGYAQAVPWSVQQERKKAAAQLQRKKQARLRLELEGGNGSGCGWGSGSTKKDGAFPQYRRFRGEYDDHPLKPMTQANQILGNDTAVHRSAVLSSTFSATGDGLLTTSGSGAYFLKLPVSKYKGEGTLLRQPRAQNDGASSSSSFASLFLCCAANLALCGAVVATGSADGVVSLWRPLTAGLGSGVSWQHSGGGRMGEAPVVTHQTAQRKDVRGVRFFYLDKYIAYASGATLTFAPYSLGSNAAACRSALEKDLDRGRNDASIGAPVFEYTTPAQQITSMDCVNHFASNLAVVASSNKSVTILDVCAEASSRTIADAHSRSVHHVVLAASSSSRFVSSHENGGTDTHGELSSSVFAAPSSSFISAQHLFASAGLDGSATLWDLRQNNAVRRFTLHKNAALTTIALAFSPTMDMLAVGSEDKSLVLYDVRNATTALDVLRCADVPTTAAFHPVEPQLAVGLSSGIVQLFSQK